MIKRWLLACMGYVIIIYSCQHAENKETDDNTITEATGTVNRDSIAPPVITPLKAPTVIPLPQPKAVPLKYPYGIGKPIFVNYTFADGLPQNLSLDIDTDTQGNLWVAGFGGLCKFDGSHFTNYRSENGIGSSLSHKLIVDSSNIWVANYEGLYRFDGRAFYSTPISAYIGEENLRCIYKDKDGAMWVGFNKGLVRMTGDSVTRFGEKEGIPNGIIWNINTDKNGRLLISTEQGIFQRDGNRFLPSAETTGFNGPGVYIVGKDRKNNLWFTVRNKKDRQLNLYRYDGKDTKIFTTGEGFNVTSLVNDLIEDKNGMIWIAHFEGLIRFDGEKFIKYTTKDGLVDNNILSLTEDNTGNIWMATTNGISRLSYSYMNTLEKIFEEETIGKRFTIGPDGTRWVIDYSDRKYWLVQYRRDDALVYDLSKFKVTTSIQSLFFDHAGDLWITVWGYPAPGKIIKFDGRNLYVYGEEQGIHISQFHNVVQDEQGNFWLAGQGGVDKLDGKTITHYGPAQGFPDGLYSILIGKTGRFWMPAKDTAIYTFDGKYVTRYSKTDGYFATFENSTAEDPFGNIWIGADNGVTRYDGKRFTTFGNIEGMDQLVAGVAVDTSRRLVWFSSLNSLVSLSFDNIINNNFMVKRFNQRNGFDIIGNHTQFNKTYFDSAGLWGSSLTGAYRFNYDKVRQLKEPPLQIRNIRIDDRQVVWSGFYKKKSPGPDSLVLLNESVLKTGKPFDDKMYRQQHAAFRGLSFDRFQKEGFIPENLKLPYRNNNITIEFTSVSPSFGKHVQYRYLLDGYTETWSPYSTKDEAYFGNMREGKYTFRLQAISATGARSELAYSFTVLPPWWRTWWAYTMYILAFITGIYTFIRWRTKTLQVEKTILEQKVTARTAELNQSLEYLKATQSQLIQSEKMASLGELTAGIAHEIQNPLNFVNNFSEVNKELIEELQEERSKEVRDFSNEDDILNDMKENEEKINHHGKRADAIVKGMLQHSRSSSGTKEPTDINALCDEYLRLSYHGLRAKDKSFNATIKTNLDENIEKINVIPQDIGRVILNLITNAFYAVSAVTPGNKDNEYEPTVTLCTRKLDDKIEISVTDNGTGIPKHMVDKIFQPFFTTKPTGQGTGLGLSLAFDIVTKGHGGELNVETKEDEGSIFTILLPK